MQIGDDYYEDLTPETTIKILDSFARGEKPKPGPQSGRFQSENSGGLTTLTTEVSGEWNASEWTGKVTGLAGRLTCFILLLKQPSGPGAFCQPEFQ